MRTRKEGSRARKRVKRLISLQVALRTSVFLLSHFRCLFIRLLHHHCKMFRALFYTLYLLRFLFIYVHIIHIYKYTKTKPRTSGIMTRCTCRQTIPSGLSTYLLLLFFLTLASAIPYTQVDSRIGHSRQVNDEAPPPPPSSSLSCHLIDASHCHRPLLLPPLFLSPSFFFFVFFVDSFFLLLIFISFNVYS